MSQVQEYILHQVSKKQLSAEEAMGYLEQLENLKPNNPQTEFAIIGLSCRFPQADHPEQFWQNLKNGRDAVNTFPRNRVNDVRLVNQKTFEMCKGLNCRLGTYFERIDLFDHTFFDLTPVEARVMDPSQRIFLEVAVEALENAGLSKEMLDQSKTGVYVGFSISDDNYIDILSKDDPNVALGNQPSLLAYRLSFLYNCKGPTMIIDTACSSSLVAVHQACQAIIQGDCEQALVGGVNVRIFPAMREIANLGIEAFDGHCKTFDEKANGTNIGDGVAAIIIKRKQDAERDGDYIHAIIKGSAVNSDGSSNGLTAPNPEAQTEVILQAWKQAKIDPENLSFVETHGTGTKLGDPIEITGLTNAFRKYTKRKQFCPLGAVKSNIGHLEATSGMAGLIKVVLCLQHRELPPNIHFTKPNPFINFEDSPVYVNTQLKKWDKKETVLTAGISSFGISGTNCHMILEEYPSRPMNLTETEELSLFVLSAKNEHSLRKMLEKLQNYLKGNPQVSLKDICYTLLKGRNHYAHRIAILANSKTDLLQKIETYLPTVEGDFKSVLEATIFYANIQQKKTFSLPESIQNRYVPLLTAYLNNQVLDFENLFLTARRIPLPTYAFHSTRHWPKLEIEEKEDAENRLKRLFHKLTWIEEPAAKNSLINKSGETYLFFILPDENHERLCDLAHQKGITVIRVYPGQTFQQKETDVFYLNPEKQEDYSQLLEAVTKNRNLEGIIHAWDCTESSLPMSSYQSLEKSQTLGTFSLFHLANAYGQVISDVSLNLVTLTSYAHKVIPNQTHLDPTHMPAIGVCKVISQEFPRIKSMTIDVDTDGFDETLAQALCREIFETDFKDSLVAYRNHKRFVQILEPQETEHLSSRSYIVKEGGVYLIAGGLGYLGLQTALSLAKQKRVKIALVGRKDPSSLTEKQKTVLDEIARLGSETYLLKGNVTDLQACQEVIQKVLDRFGAINGVVVAIKNISHQRLDVVTFEYFSNNILSKLRGVWLLDELTKEQNLDFMANFSSISSLTGGPTGADCSASNLFLDSYGDYRNDLGKRTITMNYTLIEADDGSLLSDRLSMIPPITKEEFLQTLHTCLFKEIDFSVIADFDPYVMNMVLPFMKIRFSPKMLQEFTQIASNQSKTAPVKTSSQQIPLEEVKSIMKTLWKDVLGHPEIEETADFFAIGGDSISSVKLTHLCKVQLQVEVSIADLYGYSRFEDLCLYIHKKLKGNDSKDALKGLLESIDRGEVDPELAVNLLNNSGKL